MRLIDADAITYELWTTEVEVDKSRDNGTYHYFQNRFMVDRRAIEAMPTVQRWISCSERLPEISGWYLVTNDGNTEISVWSCDLRRWGFNDKVTAWMPFPDPYGGDSE